ncbi:hypothetical protein H0Z60_12700 [Ectothiorhodospiraceae bacterium WFHF3C12]|nr:hypothetical protein [Ectothiorhodospiraceae bacterium WFHF3C12]
MRQIVDAHGSSWDVQVMFASYGVYYLIFAAQGAGEVRKSPVAADTQIQAERALADLSQEALLNELAESVGLEETSAFGF